MFDEGELHWNGLRKCGNYVETPNTKLVKLSNPRIVWALGCLAERQNIIKVLAVASYGDHIGLVHLSVIMSAAVMLTNHIEFGMLRKKWVNFLTLWRNQWSCNNAQPWHSETAFYKDFPLLNEALHCLFTYTSSSNDPFSVNLPCELTNLCDGAYLSLQSTLWLYCSSVKRVEYQLHCAKSSSISIFLSLPKGLSEGKAWLHGPVLGLFMLMLREVTDLQAWKSVQKVLAYIQCCVFWL